MESWGDPGQGLARRLRALREDCWPDIKITQPRLAEVLGGGRPLSVPLISSWESQTKPKIPPIHRLEAYATFFATARSAEGGTLRLLDPAELTDTERRARDELRGELMRLRNAALRMGDAAEVNPLPEALGAGPWHFQDGKPITIICAQLPPDMLERMPYADPADPHYIELYTYADLGALFELHGHIRAANPASQVNLRSAQQLSPDDYTTHLVSLGGVDWNLATRSVLSRLQLPVRQVADWDHPDGLYFEVDEGERKLRHHPHLEQMEEPERQLLREDIALFARGPNPYNTKRTVSICNGMYGHGTYGAVRALTDTRFRDRNAAYVRERFSGDESFSILMRITIENSVALTPDWTLAENRLHEWSGAQP